MMANGSLSISYYGSIYSKTINSFISLATNHEAANYVHCDTDYCVITGLVQLLYPGRFI